MGPTTGCHGLSGLLRWHACMLRELPSEEVFKLLIMWKEMYEIKL
jgi:hypothetical protein